MKKLITIISALVLMTTSSVFAFNLHIRNTAPFPVGVGVFEIVTDSQGNKAAVQPPVATTAIESTHGVSLSDLDDSKTYGIIAVDPGGGPVGQGIVRNPTSTCNDVLVEIVGGVTCMDDKKSEQKI